MAELRLEYRKYFAVLDLAFKLHPWLYKPVQSGLGLGLGLAKPNPNPSQDPNPKP